MLGEASSSFCIPPVGQCENTIVYTYTGQNDAQWLANFKYNSKQNLNKIYHVVQESEHFH